LIFAGAQLPSSEEAPVLCSLKGLYSGLSGGALGYVFGYGSCQQPPVCKTYKFQFVESGCGFSHVRSACALHRYLALLHIDVSQVRNICVFVLPPLQSPGWRLIKHQQARTFSKAALAHRTLLEWLPENRLQYSEECLLLLPAGPYD
jgi:hypothetical protein